MSSSRKPGKVLELIHGKPMLQYVLESLTRCSGTAHLLVATSTHPSDDAIENFCKKTNTPCFRGPLDNVAERFAQAVRHSKADAFVRICADSPLLDHRLVDKAVDLFAKSQCHMVSNVRKRTYPKGQSVEVVDGTAFLSAQDSIVSGEDKEHVTSYFYNNPKTFSMVNFESGKNLGTIQLSVDTTEDMQTVSKIIDRMTRPHWEYTMDEIVALHAEVGQ